MRPGLPSVALVVAGLTLAARILGFGRSLVFSKTVGDTCLGDVYNAANALPNVLFEIVAGGVLAGVVVPVVARHAAAGRRPQAAQTASALVTWTVLVLTPAGVAALLGAGRYASVFAKADCTGSAAVLAALLVMFVPQVWLYGLAVVSAGILQAHHRFTAAALAPLLSSVVVITAYVVFGLVAAPTASTDLAALTRTAVVALGWGTTLGVLALALCTLVPLARLDLAIRPRLRFAAGDGRVIAAIGLAGLGGLALQQVSIVLINWSAQQTGDQGALTRFTWANAVYLLPYAVLAAPLLQLAFPRLASAAERGVDDLRTVLHEVAPLVVVMAWLGAALLVATAVPVARVFVLGPGSGRTAALAVPIACFAPAVVGFALLGLASRALLAQHDARAAGVATASGWATVIAAVLVVRLLVEPAWLVPAVAASVSLGMVVGGGVGWRLLGVSMRTRATATAQHPAPQPTPLARPMLVGAGSAAAAAAGGGALSLLFAETRLVPAALGGVAIAAVAAGLFVATLGLLAPDLLRQAWASLRRAPVGAA